MISSVPIEITIGAFSIIGVLTGYAWNSQNARIKKVEAVQASRVCTQICGHIEAIQKDIEWIKKTLDKM